MEDRVAARPIMLLGRMEKGMHGGVRTGAAGAASEKAETVMDAAVALADGSAARLSEFWGSGRLVLVFLRHFG
jgi:hypothetical protein